MKLFPIKLNPRVHIGPTFWGFLFIGGFLFLTRWLFDESFFLNSLYVILLYIVIAYIYLSFVLDRITIERKSRYHRRQVGDLYEENIILINRSFLPILWMQFRDCSELNRNLANRILGFLGGHQTRVIRLSSFLQKRGNIPLSPVEIITSDPLGCFITTHRMKTKGALIILPYRVDLSSLQIKNRQSEEGRSARITFQQSNLISGSVRKYMDGDPYNRIHWPTTARRGTLHTKLPDVSIQKKVWICMDCEKKIHIRRLVSPEQERMDFLDAAKLHLKYALPPDTIEATVSITSSLAVTWLKKGIAVGLAINQQPPQIINPGFGVRQQAEILNILTYVQAISKIPFTSMLTDILGQIQPGDICFLVTPDNSPELVQTAYRLKNKGVDLRVIHINKDSYFSQITGKGSIVNWRSIRSLDFNYGDPLNDLITIL